MSGGEWRSACYGQNLTVSDLFVTSCCWHIFRCPVSEEAEAITNIAEWSGGALIVYNGSPIASL
jgi:hypothetical protein